MPGSQESLFYCILLYFIHRCQVAGKRLLSWFIILLLPEDVVSQGNIHNTGQFVQCYSLKYQISVTGNKMIFCEKTLCNVEGMNDANNAKVTYSLSRGEVCLLLNV